jgi:hypothetical protein
MKYTFHIPTQTYGYLEIEGEDKDLPEMERQYNVYAEKPINFNNGTKRIKAFVGGEIDYDETTHTYSWNGEKYMSGSEYAKKNQKPFDTESITKKMATAHGVKASDIADVWKMNAELSRDFGTVMHKALEMYGRFRGLAEGMEKEYHISSHPLLKQAVESFYVGRESEKAEYEVLIVDHASKRAGTIDRLLITAPTTCVIQDYKITTKDDKQYWADQLGFYAGILEANGWTVKEKQIFKYAGTWQEIKV